MRILGIDPGTIVTGFGIIECNGNTYQAIDFGCIRPNPKALLHQRYLSIHLSIEELIKKYRPNSLAIEAQYVNKDPQSALKLGKTLGAIIIAALKENIEVEEYYPTMVKQAVTGKGSASKEQVQGMIKYLLNLSTIPQPADAADALAIAICHAQKSRGSLIR